MLLSDIVLLELPVEWYEGVALVQEIITCQLAAGDKAVRVPQLHQVRLSEDGRIDLLDASAVDEPVRRMGQMLQALLSNSDVPVQLRLVASQATAPTPAYSSLQQYSDALIFFERPGRTAILKGIFTRAVSAADTPHADAPPTLDALAPLPPKDEPRRNTDVAVMRTKRHRVLLAVCATALFFAVAAAVKYARTDVGASQLTVLKTRTVQTSDRLGGAVVAAVSEVTDRAGLGRLAPANPQGDATAPAPPAPKPGAVSGPAPQKSPAHAPSAAVVMAFDLEPPRTAPRPPVVPVVAGNLGLPERTGTDLARALSENAPDVAVYSAESIGVSPPVGVNLQLPRQLPPELDRNQLGKMELVIAPDGNVESAKLVKAPRNVHDSMLLSAAKAWQFRPATKNGIPVRYRKMVWIATQ